MTRPRLRRRSLNVTRQRRQRLNRLLSSYPLRYVAGAERPAVVQMWLSPPVAVDFTVRGSELEGVVIDETHWYPGPVPYRPTDRFSLRKDTRDEFRRHHLHAVADHPPRKDPTL